MNLDIIMLLVELVGFGTAMFLIGLLFYACWSFFFFNIAKKLNSNRSWLVFIPIANVFILPLLAGKKWFWGFLLFIPFLHVLLAILWTWKIYQLRGYPGWLSILILTLFIPIIWYVGGIVNLIILGFVAFKDKKSKFIL